MKPKYLLGLFAFLLIIVFNLATYTVDERAQVVVTQFGKPVRIVQEPGLFFKIPFVQQLDLFDDRLLEYDSAPTEIITKDKKNLVIDNYARWRIEDPLKFLQAVINENNAQSRLDDIVYSELRVELGKHDLEEIVATHREDIMSIVTRESNEKAKDYGIEIVDVRIKRADLPPENKKAVFDRMNAERKRIANQYRSEGEEEALKIRADTDKEKVIILAEAYKKSQKIRGEGDARAIAVYADAFNRDQRFFDFVRTLEAYRKTIDANTTLVLSADAEYFKYFDRSIK